MNIIVKDYIRKWKNIFHLWQFTENNIIYAYLCMPFNLAVMLSALDRDMSYLFFAIPAIIVALSIVLHPLELNKMYYLCPLDNAERVKYIKKNYYFRVIVHMVIYLTGMILLFIFNNNASMAAVPVIGFIINSLFLSSCIPAQKEWTKRYITMFFEMPASIILSVIQMSLLTGNYEKENETVINIVHICVLLFIQVPLFTAFVKGLNKSFTELADYERRIRVK